MTMLFLMQEESKFLPNNVLAEFEADVSVQAMVSLC